MTTHEIKFLAYLKEERVMFPAAAIDWEAGAALFPQAGGWVPFSKLYLLQFSGVLDDTGKELYLGDVFENGVARWVVVFNKGCFCAKMLGKLMQPEFKFSPTTSPGTDTELALRAVRGKIKIGNIHTKPELANA